MARTAAEVNDRPRRRTPNRLSECGKQAALNQPVIQRVLKPVSVEGCDCIVGRARSM